MLLNQQFNKIWLVDFEFAALPGGIPNVVCLVAQEFNSDVTLHYWQDELLSMQKPPFDIGENALFVAYYSIAEFSVFLSLGWELPSNILDLYCEFRCLTNGYSLPAKNSLIGALQYYGLPSIEAAEKDTMRELAMRGGNYTSEERRALLKYCESDVLSLNKLLHAMQGELDFPRALLRGKYMAALSRIERNGVPINAELVFRLRDNWEAMQEYLIAAVNPQYEVYDDRCFSNYKFVRYLKANDISWPISSTGKLILDDGIFHDMTKSYPQLLPLKELRASISGFRLEKLSIGSDDRNRCMLSAFRAKTGRNQPSTSKFIFGPAVWMRGLIKPPKGYGIAYIDWSQQEFGIAAALSGDSLMKQAYISGDPYLEFAKQAGAVPSSATKISHAMERERFKSCVLAVQYGMGVESLARKAAITPFEARNLLELHQKTYRSFWNWSDSVLNYASLKGKIHTAFGWTLHKSPDCKERTIRNFPMQANGSEMLRLACVFGIEAGVKICAPIHDAVLIEAPMEELDEHIERMQNAMLRASTCVLDGFELRSGVEKFVYPNCYADARGATMWEMVQKTLQELPIPE